MYLVFLGKINLYQGSSRLSYDLELVVYSFCFDFFLPFQSCKSLPSSILIYFFKSTFFLLEGAYPCLKPLFASIFFLDTILPTA